MTGHTPPRSIRVPTELWESAKTRADERGETVTDMAIRSFRSYTAAPVELVDIPAGSDGYILGWLVNAIRNNGAASATDVAAAVAAWRRVRD